MQKYSGPIRRVIKKTSSGSEFKVDGTMNHLESRNTFIKQEFTLEQYRTMDEWGNIADEWIFEEEKSVFGLEANHRVPFHEKPVIEDRLMINKSLQNLAFKPHNSVNYLNLDNEAQTRLTPLLCSERSFNNVTKKPVLKYDNDNEIADTAFVQVGGYNRFWFGALRDYDDEAGVTNIAGKAPFFLADYTADLDNGNPPIYSAFGWLPQNLHTGQVLKQDSALYLDEKLCGLIEFKYDKVRDIYKSEPFEVLLNYDLAGQTLLHSAYTDQEHLKNDQPTTLHLTVPSMETLSSHLTPYNYFFVNDVGNAGRGSLPTPAQIAAAGINETLNLRDFVAVPCGAYPGVVRDPVDYIGQDVLAARQKQSYHEIYMFVPCFRIVKGHRRSSIARPRRFAGNFAAVLAQNFIALNNTPLIDNAIFDLANQDTFLPSTRAFWANYYSTKFRYFDGDEVTTLDQATGRYTSTRNYLYDYVKIGDIRIQNAANGADQHPIIGLQFQPDENFANYPHIRTMIDTILLKANAAPRIIANDTGEFFCLWANTDQPKDNPENMKPLRIRLNSLNTFYNKTHIVNNLYDGKFANGLALVAHKADMLLNRQVQFEVDAIPHDNVQGLEARLRHTRYRKHLNMFKNPRAETTYAEMLQVAIAGVLPNGNQAVSDADRAIIKQLGMYSKYSSELHGEDQFAKELTERSVFTFADTPEGDEGLLAVDILGTNPGVPLEFFPQRAINGSLGNANFEYYDDATCELFIPVRRQIPIKLALPHKITVECQEPFIGYTSGTNVLDCKQPLNTHKFGTNFPLSIQDYSYHFSQSFADIFKRGYLNDYRTELVVKAVSYPEFTTISEKHGRINQEDKEVLQIGELTSTIERHSKLYERADLPTIEIEVRQGMFEYLFCWIEYKRNPIYQNLPLTDPVITGLRIHIRGRENLFLKSLDASDLEQLSRYNCHKDCDWRALHDNGQGILLHLSDIGLTEEIPFGKRERIVLSVELTDRVQLKTPETGDFFEGSQQQVFNVALIRENQLLSGDFKSCRFEYYNEL